MAEARPHVWGVGLQMGRQTAVQALAGAAHYPYPNDPSERESMGLDTRYIVTVGIVPPSVSLRSASVLEEVVLSPPKSRRPSPVLPWSIVHDKEETLWLKEPTT